MASDPGWPRLPVNGAAVPNDKPRRARLPRVSVVIPTRSRPALLRRAVDSVLAQTFTDLELLVVVDGPDSETENLLAAQSDSRLRFVIHPTGRGGGAARNTGVREARAPWVAFLDDDDLWLPRKLEVQLSGLGDPRPVIGFTRLVARAPRGDYIWPRRPPRVDEHISDYLFVRSSLFAGEGGVQTSTIVAPRDLLLSHPFDEQLPRLQDTDWLLRACAAGATLEFCPDALTIWHIEESRQTITAAHGTDWRLLLRWIRQRRHLVTPRAYSAFLLQRGGAAAALRDLRAARIILRAALAGRPSAIDFVLFFGKLLAPAGLRAAVRAKFSPDRASSNRKLDS